MIKWFKWFQAHPPIIKYDYILCELCGQSFSTKKGFARSGYAFHECKKEEQKMKCLICDVKKSIKNFSNEDQEKLVCNCCKEESKMKCDVCNTSINGLVLKIGSHTDEQKNSCHNCFEIWAAREEFIKSGDHRKNFDEMQKQIDELKNLITRNNINFSGRLDDCWGAYDELKEKIDADYTQGFNHVFKIMSKSYTEGKARAERQGKRIDELFGKKEKEEPKSKTYFEAEENGIIATMLAALGGKCLVLGCDCQDVKPNNQKEKEFKLEAGKTYCNDDESVVVEFSPGCGRSGLNYRGCIESYYVGKLLNSAIVAGCTYNSGNFINFNEDGTQTNFCGKIKLTKEYKPKEKVIKCEVGKLYCNADKTLIVKCVEYNPERSASYPIKVEIIKDLLRRSNAPTHYCCLDGKFIYGRNIKSLDLVSTYEEDKNED